MGGPFPARQPLVEQVELHPDFDHSVDQKLLHDRRIAADMRGEFGLEVTSEASLGRAPINLAQTADNSALKPTRVRSELAPTFCHGAEIDSPKAAGGAMSCRNS
jgi:hypothetical protein